MGDTQSWPQRRLVRGVEQGKAHRRHAEEHRHVLASEQLESFPGFEAGHERDRGPCGHRHIEDGALAKHMGERGRAENDVRFVDVERRSQSPRRAEQRDMAQLHAFRRVDRSRGVQHDGRRLRIAPTALRRPWQSTTSLR